MSHDPPLGGLGGDGREARRPGYRPARRGVCLCRHSRPPRCDRAATRRTRPGLGWRSATPDGTVGGRRTQATRGGTGGTHRPGAGGHGRWGCGTELARPSRGDGHRRARAQRCRAPASRLAPQLGRRLETFSALLRGLRWSASPRLPCTVPLPPDSDSTGLITGLAARMHGVGLFASYRYERRGERIVAEPTAAGRGFFSGGWLEHYSDARVLAVGTELGIELSGLRNAALTLPNGATAEVDGFYVAEARRSGSSAAAGGFRNGSTAKSPSGGRLRSRRPGAPGGARGRLRRAAEVSAIHGLTVCSLEELGASLSEVLGHAGAAPQGRPPAADEPAAGAASAAAAEELTLLVPASSEAGERTAAGDTPPARRAAGVPVSTQEPDQRLLGQLRGMGLDPCPTHRRRARGAREPHRGRGVHANRPRADAPGGRARRSTRGGRGAYPSRAPACPCAAWRGRRGAHRAGASGHGATPGRRGGARGELPTSELRSAVRDRSDRGRGAEGERAFRSTAASLR